MSYLDKLLKGVEVEWKSLGECIKSLKTGLNPRQNFQLNTSDAANYYVTVREIQNGKIVFVEQTDRVNAKALELINNRSNLEEGDILFSGTGTVGRIAVIEEKPVNWNIKEGVYVIKPEQSILMSKFLAYTLNSGHIVKEFSKKIVGSPVCSLPMSELKKLQIPIPPLSIQKEIFRILDTFTELTAELTTELTARKKQYNYYREQLLNFEDGDVEWKTLGELCKIGDGLHGTPKYDDKGEYYFINGNNLDNGKIVFTNNTKKVDAVMYNKYGIVFTCENTIFLSINGTIGSVSFFNNEKIVLGKSVAYFNIESTNLNSKYLFYFLQTNYSTNYFEAEKTGSTIKNLGLKALRKFKIPMPPIAEQERIVAILDKFDTLTTSLSEGLPKEIELRKKQYEYYRDMLLTFPKKENE